MVIVRLTGGLGNQLFQYAAARRLTHVNDSSLKLDISHFGRDPARAYALGHFNIQATIASPEEVAWFSGREIARRTKRLLHSLHPNPRWKWVSQSSLYFDPTILTLKGDVYLDGAWQSEKYFQDIAPVLRRELTVQREPDPANRAMSEEIQRVESVSLHIRRGDYVTNPAIRRMHGLCSLEHYASAIRWLAEQISQPQIFVFSDDPDWAREHLQLDYPATFVRHNRTDKHYEDLRLMSQCHHHIIANSSFSWWGAWLCTYSNKTVIAPCQWFHLTEYNIHDVVPTEWHLI